MRVGASGADFAGWEFWRNLQDFSGGSVDDPLQRDSVEVLGCARRHGSYSPALTPAARRSGILTPDDSEHPVVRPPPDPDEREVFLPLTMVVFPAAD